MSALYLVTPENNDQAITDQAVHLAEEFSFQCGFRMLPYMVKEMERYLLDGFQPDMITEAIARTARAPRPSFAYLAAIMRNAKAAGHYDYASYSKSHRLRCSPSQIYEQRHYTAEEWASFGTDILSECKAQSRKAQH